MNKQNQFCFLVKKKRPRKSAGVKGKLNEEGVGRKPKEKFSIKGRHENPSTGEKENMGKSKIEEKENNFKFVESGQNIIVLKRTEKSKKSLKPVKEKQNDKIFNSEKSAHLLDFDKFLEEINSYSYQQITDKTDQQTTQITKKENKFTNKGYSKKRGILKGKIVNNKYKHIDQNKLQINKSDKGDKKLYKKLYKRKAKIAEKEDIYNINNFIIHPNQIKITIKVDVRPKIQTPQFKQIDAENKDDKFSVSSFSSIEDTSDLAYIKLHSHFETRERDYLLSLMDDPKKKKVRLDKHKTLNGPTISKTNATIIINATNKNFNTRQLFDCSNTATSEGNFKFRVELDKD